MVNEKIHFELHTELIAMDPKFTLTCISTGGPATTVTWTRDSVTLTQGNETVLDDPVTAQYNHTLTVTGRLGGLYTCTVDNSIPSKDNTNIILNGKHTRCIYVHDVIIYPPSSCLSSH